MKLNSLIPHTGKYSAVAATGTGLLAAFAVILLFVVAATCLESVFFGLIFAYLFLPVEQFCERIFFRSRPARVVSVFFSGLFLPLRHLRRKLMRYKGQKTPEEKQKAKENAIAGKAAGITLFLLLVFVVLGIYFAVSFAVPFVKEKGTEVMQNLQKNEKISILWEDVEKKLDAGTAGTEADSVSPPAKKNWAVRLKDRISLFFSRNRTAPAAVPAANPEPQTAGDGQSAPQSEQMKERIIRLLRSADISWIGTLFSSGTDILSGILAFLSMAGGFAFDLMMFCFFFFFFLQRMAFYRNSLKEKTAGFAGDTGKWLINCIAESGWLPGMNDRAKESAAGIIGRLLQMFNSWLRGYGIIILLEWLLYSAFFFFFGVPYAVPLALLAAMTILLPFLGPVLGFSLTLLLTYSLTQTILPAAGVCLAYLLINCILEQLFLYPVLVGESIGLTTLETIVAVLFGAVVAGITGMILAVPAAALLKFLMPLVYDVLKQKFTNPDGDETI